MKSLFTKLSALSALFAAGSAFAATFVVNNLGDSGPGTLRQAILDANAAPGDDNITFSIAGTITLATNLPAITDGTAIVGPGTNNLTINGVGKYRIFYFTNALSSNFVSDLTIASGRNWGMSFLSGLDYRTNAPGIANLGTLTLRKCTVRDCTAEYSWGGGIYNAGTLDMKGCVVKDCIPAFAQTAAPFLGAGIFNSGVAKIRECYIGGCRGANSGPTGSGIYNTNGASLFVTDSRIDSCRGSSTYPDGGGIANRGDAILNSCVISNCYGYWGGGVESFGTFAATNCAFVKNSSSEYGGGLFLTGQATLNRCTIANNQSWRMAGGISSRADLKLYNCTLAGNNTVREDVPASGAAIADFWDYSSGLGVTYMEHCTLAGNLGAQGEIATKGSFQVKNSILPDCRGPLNSVGNNLIINTNGATITNVVAGNIYNTDPMLGPLQNNGGTTLTRALLSGSPAIDAGAGSLSTDQRGALRSGIPDIGAYEVVSVFPPALQIARADPSHVLLYWPSASGPVVLQQNSSVVDGQWTDVSVLPMDNGTTFNVILPTDNDSMFFRLRSP